MPDITYVGSSEGDYFELFHLLADGNSDGTNRRPVLEILISPDNKIWIAGVEGHGNGIPQETKGEVHRHTDAVLAAELGYDNATHVCMEPTRATRKGGPCYWPRVVLR